MQTTAEFFSALNTWILDIGPFVALAVLAVVWFLKGRKYREEEKELRGRIDSYKTQYSARESGEVTYEGREEIH